MNKLLNLSFLIIIMFVASCKPSENKNLLPSVIGSANEVIVVISGANWNTEPGDTIRAFLREFMPGLPQQEPMFNLLFVPHSGFDQVYKKHRNIIITQIGPDYKEKFLVGYNTWAKPQVVITVMAPNKEAFVNYFIKIQQDLKTQISNFEKERLISNFTSAIDKDIHKNLLEKHQVDLTIPKGFVVANDYDSLIWFTNEYRDIIEGIIVYSYPYTDKQTFTTAYLVEKRNELLKKYIQGEIEGSFITTEEEYPVDSLSLENNNLFAMELRGLWRMDNGVAMGGPFMSLTQYDEKRQRIVTTEGFVFAPAHDKRNLMRRVEAIVYTMKFPE